MQNDKILTHLLAAPAAAADWHEAGDWWRACQASQQQWLRPIEQSIVNGFAADRMAWVFAGGYQAALRSLFPVTNSDIPASFCVTESGGSDPAQFTSRVRVVGSEVELTGAKSWIASGPDATRLFVLARLETDTLADQPAPARPPLRVVAVDSRSSGVTMTAIASPRLLPELPQSRARFDAVRLPLAALLGGDAHAAFVKPFRGLETMHVMAGATGFLLREGRAGGWDRRLLERMLVVLSSLLSLAEANPLAPATEIALAGTLETANQVLAGTDALFESRDDMLAQCWRRDRKFLSAMATPRATRTDKAWQKLG